MSRSLDMWFDFASTYSFLTIKRIDRLAAAHGVTVRYRPFLLGPIFKAQGWSTSPFFLYPAKGRYMVRDISRIAATRGHNFVMPNPAPQRSITAARVVLSVAELAGESQVPPLVRSLFEAEFEHGRQLDDMLMLGESVNALGLDSQRILQHASSDGIKSALRLQTERAAALDIFGAPTFITQDGELFWGDDRLEMALQHAARL